MEPNTALFLDHFAQKCSLLIQDEVQGFHWNNKQCSLHPVVIYFQDGYELRHQSLLVLSHDLTQDVPFVYEVKRLILDDFIVH